MNPYYLYNIMASKEYYINPTAEGKLSWRSAISCTYDIGDALENWESRIHEVSMRRWSRITRFIQRVGAESSMLHTYEGLPNLASFLVEFEEKL